MRKLFTHLFVACLYTGTATAQKLERLKDDDFVMSIIQAEIDGEDCTEIYLKAEAFLALYERKGQLYFANAWQKTNSQSYGEVTVLDYKEYNDAEYYTETVSLLWKYANTYDNETGTAVIHIRLTHRPVAVAFELSIMTEKAEILMFKGYVNDSLNWKPYF